MVEALGHKMAFANHSILQFLEAEVLNGGIVALLHPKVAPLLLLREAEKRQLRVLLAGVAAAGVTAGHRGKPI